MPTIPIQIVQADVLSGGRYGIVSGRLTGRVRAGVDVTAAVCHGIQLGIDAQAMANANATLNLLIVGGRAQGQLEAEAGVKAVARLEPNPFQTLGLSLEGGAYAYAAAAGSLAVYFTAEHVSRFANEQLTPLAADLLLIFAEELRVEVGVFGKVAASAAADGYLNAILDINNISAGFEISCGFNFGLGAGGGADAYADAGFNDLRRAVSRSSYRVSQALVEQIRTLNHPSAAYLAYAFDFCFPLLTMTAYDIGNKAHERKALLQPQHIAPIITNNLIESLQRSALQGLIDSAIDWLKNEVTRLYYRLSGVDLVEADLADIESNIDDLLQALAAGEQSLHQINTVIVAFSNIIDRLDGELLTPFKRPLTLFWCASVLSMRASKLLDGFYAELSGHSTAVGEVDMGLSGSQLPDAPDFVPAEIEQTLSSTGSAPLAQSLNSVDVSLAVDYLVAIGVAPLLQRHAPQFELFRLQLEQTFHLSAGDVLEDLIRSISSPQTRFEQLNSYQSFRQLVQQQLLEELIIGELLPSLKQHLAQHQLDELILYLDEVVEPSLTLVNDFLFSKLDELLITSDGAKPSSIRLQLANDITAGSGVVIYRILARNMVYFDRIFSDFFIDEGYASLNQLTQLVSDDEQPFFLHCQNVLQQNLPGRPDLSRHSAAVRELLLAITSTLAMQLGPSVMTTARRAELYELKRDVLLSMAGQIDNNSPLVVDQLIADIQNCLHLPNLPKAQRLTELLVEIQLDAVRIAAQHLAPALAEFYLALTLDALQQTRRSLNSFIQQLATIANQLIERIAQLTDRLRTTIERELNQLTNLIRLQTTRIQLQIASNWAQNLRLAIRLEAEQIVLDNIDDEAAQAAALAAFYVGDWLIIGPILDAVVDYIQPLLVNIIDRLDNFASAAGDSAQALLDWQAQVEAQVLALLSGIVTLSAERARDIVMDYVFPETLMDDIQTYLTQLRQLRRLQQEQALAQAELSLIEAQQQQAVSDLNAHQFDDQFNVEIVQPASTFERVYPASLTVVIRVSGSNWLQLTVAESSRIQLRLNGQPLPVDAQDWQFVSATNQYQLSWQSADGHEFVQGMNVLEVSWITGPLSTDHQRKTALFSVDLEQYVNPSDWHIEIDANPPGRDVDQEYAMLRWHGEQPTDLHHWQIQDLARHKYVFPELTLNPGQAVQIFTGGSPADDHIASDSELQRLHMGRRAAIWNNEGDTLLLINASGTQVASFSYPVATANLESVS
ncbi:lamin tail domain-containing protein [Neiella sp. HB171785]|uniref:Lamin tail domain-containing protein n=1 Tax=Neiella litorisoli TaxID=2771431 RepID=A0A8J6QJ85_9GAMM|nr:lamin tail domain-containing protein [Neiella litorisoli]MBD1389111.1 lamin tail domain-containing protein [Neiella litorisoli]